MQNVIARFREEQKTAPLSRWEYIERSRSKEQLEKISAWRGKESLKDWLMNITGADVILEGKKVNAPRYMIPEHYLNVAKKYNAILQEDTGVPDHFSEYDALDFLMCSVIPTPARVLDYAAGYGRQSFLFSQVPDCKLFVTDAVEISYCAQKYVFDLMHFPQWEYFDQQKPLEEFLKEPGFGIAHYPSWRDDLIPSRSLDLALFVWCLSEMPESAARNAIDTCARALKEGGYVYIRDMPHTHGWNIEKYLWRKGFKLAMFPWKLHKDEVSGSPRLYRYLPNSLDAHNAKYFDIFTIGMLRSYTPKEILKRVVRLFR